MEHNSIPLIFFHVGKAGGSSLRDILKRYYNKENVYTISSKNNKKAEREFTELSPAELAGIKLLMGHMHFGLHEYFPGADAKYFTFLRHPVSRLISSYEYAKRHPFHQAHKKFSKANLTFEESLGFMTFNRVTMQLAGVQDKKIPCNDNFYNQAIENLERHFVFVGLMEKFNESVLLLAKTLDWTYVPPFMRKNVGNSDKTPVSQALKEKIAGLEYYDMKIYNYVKAKFDVTLELNSNYLEETLPKYLQANDQYKPTWNDHLLSLRDWLVQSYGKLLR